MHFGDSIFIFLLALVLFGPKKMPEIGRQVGKLLAEFRRASNEFKFQIQEEIRNMEEEERRKKLEESRAAAAASTQTSPAPEQKAETSETDVPELSPKILPPAIGEKVSASRPFATPAELEAPPLSPDQALNSANLVDAMQDPVHSVPESNGAHPLTEESREHESVHHD